jgi:hypothetical protein
METTCIDVVLDIFPIYGDVLLIENTLYSPKESNDFRVLAQQTQNNVVTCWALSTIETDTDSLVFHLEALAVNKLETAHILTPLLESDHLVALV